MIRVFAVTATLTVLACSTAPAQQASPASGGDVVARIGDRAITAQELDERWKATNPAQHSEATQRIYDGRRETLEAMVAETLIAEAAKRAGQDAPSFEDAEIGKRARPVTDGDVVAFYQANTSQMQGRSLDVMTPAIRRYLQDQQRAVARQELIAELSRSGPSVRVLLEPPRHDVAIADTDPSIGNPAAPVTVVEFSDFQCPFCQRVVPTLKQVREKYGDKVRVVWKDFPLTQIHPQAFKAAEAGHCAGEQGKYWEYHDRLFANQQALQPDDLKQHASALGLDMGPFNTCLDSSKYGERVRDGVAQGSRLGVDSTPTIYINGRVLAGAQPFEVFAAVIDEELQRTGRN